VVSFEMTSSIPAITQRARRFVAPAVATDAYIQSGCTSKSNRLSLSLFTVNPVAIVPKP
jgi:hypothetical protein